MPETPQPTIEPTVDPVPVAPTDSVAAAQEAAATSAQATATARAAAARALAEQRAAAEQVAAHRTAAQELSMDRAAALATALTHSQTTQAALDTARGDLEATRASQTIAQGRATLVHRLAVEASQQASVSTRSFAVLARKLAQQQNGAGIADVFLGGHSLGNVLDQLSTLDQLDRVTDNIETIKAQAEADQARADKLSQQDTETRAAASSVPVDASQATLDAASSDFETASLALVTAASQAANAAATLAALDLRPIIRTDVGQLGEQGWANPVHGAITDTYGPRPIRPLPGVGAFHYGTDIGAGCRAPVFAATSGIVRAASSVGSYGNWILIDHGEGVQTGYAHLTSGETLVAAGDRVTAGQQIGSVGSTGLSTGCHSHLEVRVDGVRIDPQTFFLNRSVVLGG
ncbi:M23 family metallopeptidase [Cryobacterium suzukii]|uniref:M23 family metallopeptidase n=1 Tax=Cryobacterium suzukii TaxID=1259198 RepID=A0A4R9AK34_9MICO|nr:M23 family metallopeptidase [Cryobacterium suzukii]